MRVLILGATGMMGHMACRVLGPQFEVHAACRSWGAEGDRHQEFFADCVKHEGFEALEDGASAGLIRRVQPDAVMNFIGIVKQKPEAGDADVAKRLNAILPRELADACDAIGAKLIQMSTDCVFSGRGRMYRETDAPDPEDTYGLSKLQGEVTREPHLTIRTSIIGRQIRGDTGLLEWFRLQRGGTVQGYANAIFSGLTTRALAEVLADLMRRTFELHGLYHVATTPISKFDLLGLLNTKLDLEVTIDRDEEFRCDRSLDARRFLEATGMIIPTYDAMIEQLAEDDIKYG